MMLPYSPSLSPKLLGLFFAYHLWKAFVDGLFSPRRRHGLRGDGSEAA